MKIVYSPNYNITFFGIERLHPFDSRKYGRAWNLLKAEFGSSLSKYHARIRGAVGMDALRLAHTDAYLKSLHSSAVLAAALEIPLLASLPASFTHWRVLRPMRWAVAGSIEAARCALQSGIAVNLSGGYHHAKPANGEGFCLFSDAAMIVRQLRLEGRLEASATILYIDLDAHQGNGVCHQFLDDPQVRIFDMYNKQIYPASDFDARARIDCDVPLESKCTGAHYLRLLRGKLPGFLGDSCLAKNAALCIYNAGTDPYAGDQLGSLSLSAADILERDLFVFEQLTDRQIPVVMLLSGGYSQESYRLVAATIRKLVQRCEKAGITWF